jgi:hypothetical protein
MNASPAIVTEIQKPSSKKITKLKAIDPKAAEPSRPKILIFGKAGVGKTWTALDFPSVYYIDTEGGADLEHYTEKLKKSGGVYFGPEQGSQDFATVIEQIQALATEEHHYKTVVIDSISKLFNIAIANEAERLGDKDVFGASKKPAINLTRRLINWIDRLDMNVILIAHEKPLWAGDKQVGVTYDAWEKLEYELHLCLNILKTGDSRKAFVRKSRLTGFPDASGFSWSYSDFAKRYGTEVIEADAKPLLLATPEQLEEVKRLLDVVKLSETDKLDKWIGENKEDLAEVTIEKMEKLISHLKGKIA